MHKTRAAVLILFLASTLAFGGCLVRQQTGKRRKRAGNYDGQQ